MTELASQFRVPGKRGESLIVRALRAVWTLPTNVIGHLAGWIVSGKRPVRVASMVAVGWLYPIRKGIGLDWVGAVTLGHVILHRAGMFEGLAGRAVLAHELAHTRQHDVLGPVYLPLHVAAQSISALLSLVIPGRVHSRVHAYNPLEHTFICLGASACHDLAQGRLGPPGQVGRYLERFGV